MSSNNNGPVFGGGKGESNFPGMSNIISGSYAAAEDWSKLSVDIHDHQYDEALADASSLAGDLGSIASGAGILAVGAGLSTATAELDALMAGQKAAADIAEINNIVRRYIAFGRRLRRIGCGGGSYCAAVDIRWGDVHRGAFDIGFRSRCLGWKVRVARLLARHQGPVFSHCRSLLLRWVLAGSNYRREVVSCAHRGHTVGRRRVDRCRFAIYVGALCMAWLYKRFAGEMITA